MVTYANKFLHTPRKKLLLERLSMAGQIISRRPNTWLVRIYLGRDGSGKRRYFNKTVHGTKKDAQKWLTAALREKDLGVAFERSRARVDEYLDKWLEVAARPKVRAKTLAGYEQMLRSHIRPQLGSRVLTKLTTMEIQERYNAMLESGLSPRTIQYSNMIFKQSLKQAVEWGLLLRNPCQGVTLPRKQHREMAVWTPQEVGRFLAVARDDPAGVLFELAVTTGLRPSEYLALKWLDIDFERGTVSINRSIDFSPGGGWAFAENKTGRSRRVVKLLSGLIPRVRTHQMSQEAIRKEAGEDWQEHGLVFTTDIGTPIDRHNLTRRAFYPLVEAAGVSRIRLYDLRHTAATLALAAGVPVKVLSEQLGHASATLTLDTYSHVLPHMQEEAATKVEALLRKAEEEETEIRHTIGTQAIQ